MNVVTEEIFEAVAETPPFRNASRAVIQVYLQSRGFAVYDSEDTEMLREAARLQAEEEAEDGE
jgi:hypothetical protein